jgi:hypothetical protein
MPAEIVDMRRGDRCHGGHSEPLEELGELAEVIEA